MFESRRIGAVTCSINLTYLVGELLHILNAIISYFTFYQKGIAILQKLADVAKSRVYFLLGFHEVSQRRDTIYSIHVDPVLQRQRSLKLRRISHYETNYSS